VIDALSPGSLPPRHNQSGVILAFLSKSQQINQWSFLSSTSRNKVDAE
jgi:hypothetical protein